MRCKQSYSSNLPVSGEKATTSSLKLLACFQSFFSFFQLWADASLIKTLLLYISDLFNYPNVGGTQTYYEIF